jgi:hypothetical protein
MKKLLLSILVLLWAGSSWAQVNLYTFASSTGTYTALSTETILCSVTFDDNNSTAITIPSMTVAGTAYTTMFVQANGWITLGGTTIASSYVPISQTTAYPVVISAFGRDLNNAAAGTPKISYNTNDGGEIVVQYQDVRRYNVSGERLSFQIRLNPSTGIIKFVYGGTITGGASTSYPQVGLRGATNAVFNNRTTTTNWAATTAGAINTATCLVSATITPTVNLTYTFTPPVAGTPDPPTSPNPANAAIGVPVSGSVTWTFGANTVTYDLMFGPTGSMVQVVTGASAGATGSYAYSGLNTSSIYQWQVIEKNGALTTNGPVWSFTTVCGAYAIPFAEGFDAYTPPSVGCGTVIDVNADAVKWACTAGTTSNGANKLSIGYSAVGVTMNDWYISPGLNLTGGVSYDVKFYYRAAYTSYVERLEVKWGTAPTVAGMTSSAIFSNVDFNYAAYTLGSGSFTPPSTGVYYVGWHCYSLPDEDGIYLDQITVELSPACPAPNALTTTNISTTTAQLDWTPVGTATLWEVKYGPPGFDPATAGTLISGIAAHPYTLNPPLNPNTNYDWYVRTDCGGGIKSTWAGPGSFRTLCSDATIPFSESFDGATFTPDCWMTQKTAGTSLGVWDRQTTGTYPTCAPHSGAGMTRFNSYNYSSGTAGTLVTPAFLLPAPSQDYMVRFWMYRDNGYASNADLVNVRFNTSPSLTGATLLGTINRSTSLAPVVAANGWYEYAFTMPSGQDGTSRYVIFEAVSLYGNNMFVDDVSVLRVASLEGIVKDFNGNPLPGATVVRVGGISTTSGPGGDYLLTPLSAGSQQFMCSKTGYNDEIVTLDIPESAAVVHDFTLTNPEMAITPGSLFKILYPTELSSSNLIITNDGNGPLGWTAEVNYTGTPVVFSAPAVEGPLTSVYTPGENSTIGPGNGQALEEDGNRADLMVCPDGSMFSIPPVGSTTGYTSTAIYPYFVYQSFSGVNGWINSVTFWGLYTVAPAAAPTFTINICLPGATPGAVVATVTAPVTGYATGVTVLGYPVYVFTATVPSTPLSAGWVGVQQQDASPTFYWLNTTSGAGYHAYQVGAGPLSERVALCLGGIGGWLTLDNSGTVPPFGGMVTVPVGFDPNKAQEGGPGIPGKTYTADIVFTSPSGIESVTIPATMVITNGGIKGPQELGLYVVNEAAGQFMLKWKYFTIRGLTFDHFVILRNDEIHGTSVVSAFDEVITEPGAYCYKVYAVYSDGAYSDPSNEVCLTYPLAPGVPVSNWALLLGGLLIGAYAFYMIWKRS